MTRCPRLSLNRPRHRRSRWIGAATLIVGVHVSGVAIGMMKWEEPAEPPSLPPAVMIDLQPPAAPAPAPAAEPERAEAEPVIDIPDAELPPEPELSEFLPPPPPQVEPVVQLAPKVEKKKKETEKAKKKAETKKKAEKKPEETKTADKKPAEKPKQPETATPAKAAAPATYQTASAAASSAAASSAAAPTAAEPAGMSAGQLALAGAAKANWEGAMRALIEKHKKYPRSAQRRNQEGMPYVAVKIDRGGNLLEVRVARSSGVDSLDEAAVEAFQRAAPLPSLPPEMDVAVHSFTLPLNFTLKEE